MGVGLVFRVDGAGTAIVESVAPGSPADGSDVRPGDALWKIGARDVYRANFQDMAEVGPPARPLVPALIRQHARLPGRPPLHRQSGRDGAGAGGSGR